MIFPRFKVELYKFINENTVSVTPLDISEAVQLSTTAGIETKKDAFKLTFNNYKLNGMWKYSSGNKQPEDNFIRAGDNIKVYVWTGSEPTNFDQHLLMDGEVTTYYYDNSETGTVLTINGYNRTETMLSTLVPTTQTKDSAFNTSPLIIKELMQRVNKFNPQKKLSFALDNEINPDTGEYGKIQSTDSQGNAFPEISYFQNYKSAYEQLEELSGPDFTGDDISGQYLYYIVYSETTEDGYVNELVWKSKSYTESGSLTLGIDLEDMNISYDLSNVVNAMIVSAGQDCYGHGKTTLVWNAESMGKYGAKWKFYPATNIIPDLIKNEKNIAETAGSTHDEYFFPDVLESGSYQMSFDMRDEVTGEYTTPYVVGNKKEFNDALREEGKWLAKEEAQRIVDLTGEPIFRVDSNLSYPSLNTYIMGNLYVLINESFGWEGTGENPGKKLRLYQSDHLINNQGWTVRLSFKEDEKTIGVV